MWIGRKLGVGTGEERSSLVGAPEKEQALGDLLEDVAVGLAERLELGEQRLLLSERLLEISARTEAAGDRPACDPSAADPAVAEPFGPRASSKRAIAPSSSPCVVSCPAHVARERADPSTRNVVG